jgi:small-conductance mechanosensitive channel
MEMGYFYAAATILFGTLLAITANFIVRWLRSKAHGTETRLDDIIIAAIGKPLQVTIIAVSFYIALKYFGIVPEQYLWILDDRIVNSFYIIIGAWVISSFIHDIIIIYGHAIAERTASEWDDRLIELLELVAKYVIWFAAVVLILYTFRVDITPFLAGAGIAGLAIALAAQDILSNFFGGAIITMDKPFKINDRIKIDTYVGDVVSIGPRSTRIRTLDYQIVTIPNNKITTNVIVNYAMPDLKLRITIPVAVAYGTEVKKVKQILLEIARDVIKKTEYLLEEPAPKVFFLEFGESSLKFVLYVWAKAYNLPDEVKDAVNSQIAERFAQEGIEIPFQQLDVRLKE